MAAVHTQCGLALQGEIQEDIPHSRCGKETMGLRWLMKCPFILASWCSKSVCSLSATCQQCFGDKEHSG